MVLYCEMQQDLHLCSTQAKHVTVQGSEVPENGGIGLHTGTLVCTQEHKKFQSHIAIRHCLLFPACD